MVGFYILSVIFIVIAAVSLIRGAYLLYSGVRYQVSEEIYEGAKRLLLAVTMVLLLWAIGFPWGGEWLKIFVTEYAVALKAIAGVLILIVGIPLLFICLALIKWFLLDPKKKATIKSKSSENDKE